MYISALRAKLNLGQKELAKELGVSYRTIQGWESDPNKLPRKKAAMVAQYFNVSVDSLYVEEPYIGVSGPSDLPDLITPLIDYKVGRKPIPGDTIDSIVVELNRIPLLEAERAALYKELERDE